MGNLYYLAAQLPSVTLNGDGAVKPPIQYAYFLDLCERFMDAKDFCAVKDLSLEPPREKVQTGSFFLDRWYEWERDLRLSLAQFRAQKMKKEFSDPAVANITQDIQQIARSACACDSPLEAEQYLNAERLKKIEELTPTDSFCADAVFAYGLKLQMAGRIQKFDEDTGMNSYRIIYDQILGESK